MQKLLESDHFTIQSKIRWFPSFNTKFQIVNDGGQQIGEIIFHPVIMAPILWFFGLLLELALAGGGLYLVFTGENNVKLVGAACALVGAFLIFVVNFRTFLASRASSSVEIFSESGEKLIAARKGWALFRPTFSVYDATTNELIGESRQSMFWGDRYYTVWDKDGNTWGSIKRRVWGFQYRVFRGSEQVARFRRKLIDTRKLITGLRSYLLEYEQEELSSKDRALILGCLAYADVLTRQKKLRDEQGEEAPAPKPAKK